MDLLIIAGDITSISDSDEYEAFVGFIDEVRRVEILPKRNFWSRIVLVPGNHEVFRTPAGRGDCLDRFDAFVRKLYAAGRYVSTPYSSKGQGSCVVSGRSKEGAPFALHRFADINLDVLALVSCYYGQFLDKEVLDLIEIYGRMKAELASTGKVTVGGADVIESYFVRRKYLDTGFFSTDYVSSVQLGLAGFLAKAPAASQGHARIAVGHHAASQYFEAEGASACKHGIEMLERLADLGFSLYLHGHIHCAPGPSLGVPNEVASAALGGHPAEGHHGFNLFVWPRGKAGSSADAVRYELRQEQFRPVQF